MTLFADLLIGIACGYGVAIVERVIGKRRKRQPLDIERLIMVDQFTEQRRKQHANVGHKAAKGFQGKH